jgi:hypothetical protein
MGTDQDFPFIDNKTMNVKFFRMVLILCLAMGMAGCDARKCREPDPEQQQWARIQNNFEVIRLIDSGKEKDALLTFRKFADPASSVDPSILKYFSEGEANKIRTTLNMIIDGWIIQESCHSQHPPLTVLLDNPDRLRFLANLATYRTDHPNLPFNEEVDKTITEILLAAQQRTSNIQPQDVKNVKPQ